MKHVEIIIENKDFKNGELYVYSTDYCEKIKILKKITGDICFQNEQHKKDYLSQKPGFCPFVDLESGVIFDLDLIDYMEERYRIFPLSKENLGFILSEMRRFKKNINLVLKHFLANN